ncbi:unnamed protein product [Rotaria socialis]|uniref:Tubulin polyglutamylase TTLL11 n=3 Tax=Rotaria socialis TaxID=392032 RepID=A0A821KC28_9BILA|nr:unnamed protein product [Rotaria socialis]CAF3363772.1 unnamed protein product [Rotaria socialis]CAF3582650.1 unnamed protein product [Rotaria socialis]CAF4733136.1 unnamed protein product [Rotaria socialis]
MAPKTSVSRKIKNRNSGKRVPTVDTTQARSNMEVVRMCLKDLGWKEYGSGSSSDADIYWNSATFQQGNRNYTSTSARVNKFPGMCDLMHKTNLTRSLNVMRMLFPDEFDFYPKTWFLPEQIEQFQDDAESIHKRDRRQHRPLTTFIVKPSDGSEGAGIYLIQDSTHCSVPNRPHIVQEYIDRPLLMNGLKFDIRIYVLILKLDPLEVLLYDEGLVRFATVNYQPPSTKNLHEAFMHLTNYSLNKRSTSYKHALDEKQTDASKRKLSIVWSQLGQLFSTNEIEQAKEMIKELINKTILAILPELRVQYASELPITRKQNRCFQIIGFDILLTDQLKPILLEVNANPSLRIDFDHVNEAGKFVTEPSAIDEDIKKSLVLETLKRVIKCKRNRKLSEPNDEMMTQEDKKVVHRQTEAHSKLAVKHVKKTHYDRQLSASDSDSSSCISEELSNEEQQYQTGSNQNRKPKNLVNLTLANTGNESQTPNENTTSGASDSMLADGSVDFSTLDRSMTITGEQNVTQSSVNRTDMAADTPITNKIKSLKIIFPSASQTKYEQMFLPEKIAFIYIELVVKRGYKAMTNWPFRNLAKICGLVDQSTTMISIDMLYTQIFYKLKQYDSQSPATGLDFPAFIEAFFLLSQRKYSNSYTLVDSVTELVKTCIRHLDPSADESA